MKSVIDALKAECAKGDEALNVMERRQEKLKTALRLMRELDTESQELDPDDIVSVRAAIRAACEDCPDLELSKRDLMPYLPGVSDYMFSQAVKSKINGVRRVGVRAGRKYTASRA